MESRGLPRARRQAGAPRSSRVSSRPQFARCSCEFAHAVRALCHMLLARSSRVVRTLLARCSHAFRTRSSHF